MGTAKLVPRSRLAPPDGISICSSTFSSVTSIEDRIFIRKIIEGTGSRLPLRHLARILVVQVVTLIALIVVSVFSLMETKSQLETATLIQHRVRANQLTGELVVALQIERGLSATYLSSQRSDMNVLEDVQQARASSDDALASLLTWPSDGLEVHIVAHFQTISDFKIALGDHREQVESLVGNTSVQHNIQFYTAINNALMASSIQEGLEQDHQQLWAKIVAKDNLLHSSDLLGIKRALGCVHYGSCKLSQDNLNWFIRVSAQGEILLDQAFNYHNFLRKQWNERVLNIKFNIQVVDAMVEEISRNVDACAKYGQEAASAMSLAWFWNITYIINTIASIHREASLEIQDAAQKVIERAQVNVMVQIIVVVIVVFVCFILGAFYSRQSYRLVSTISNYAHQLRERKNELQSEKKHSDRLLYQMLPRSIAMQLKAGKAVTAVKFEDVTVYFSDIVDFTEITAEIAPIEVVILLNKLYSVFDSCIENYDVYKVETIGDAYMVVSGLPEPTERHAWEIGSMAIDLRHATKSCTIPCLPDKTVILMIGIHTGPCAAGVVGIKMPRYCLFGDTVNTASRMETTGEASRIHLSAATKVALEKDREGSRFHVIKRGDIMVKGKGIMTTYWLEGAPSPLKRRQRVAWQPSDDIIDEEGRATTRSLSPSGKMKRRSFFYTDNRVNHGWVSSESY